MIRLLKQIFKIVLFSVITFSVISCSVNKNTSKPNNDKDPRIKNFNFNFYFLEANKQKILGNFEEALMNYQMALKIDETQSSVYYEIAGILNLQKDYSGALKYAKKSVELDKTNNGYYLMLLAEVYQNNNLFDEAIKTYKNIIKLKPENIYYYFELSDIFIKQNKPAEAIKTLDEAEKTFGIVDMISLEKEKCYILMGDTQNALQEIIILSDSYPENMRFKTILAESYINARDYESARKVFEEIEKTDIQEGIIYFSMADFYRLIKEYDKMFNLLEKGFVKDDVDAEIKIRMILSLLDNYGTDPYFVNNIDSLLQTLTSSYPENLTVRALNSDFFIFKEDYKSAQKEYDYILARDKNKYEIWKQALYVDYLLVDMQNMYTRSKEATELYPNVLEFYRYYIISAYSTEHYDEVAKAVDYASILSVSDQVLFIDFLTMQADSYHKLGQHHQSDSVFELILYKDSENLPALNNYSYFLALRNENIDRALELSKKLIELSPNEPSYLDTYAWVLFRNKEYEKALEYINRAIEIDKENAVYYEHRGDILFLSGDTELAVESWIKASEMGKGSDLLDEKIKNKTYIE
ncbi:MAG TPA: tetratricopeptide repeat protein [Bacteroidales bacterium]|nr:tetratricopeptide repeat protein [Bacteroidales bacterium]